MSDKTGWTDTIGPVQSTGDIITGYGDGISMGTED